MTRLTARVEKVKDEVEKLLDDDDDMAGLYLSRKAASASPVSGSGPATVRNDVKELEMLIEAFLKQIHGTLNKLTTLQLILTCASVCISLYSLVPGIFGMNLPTSWNHRYDMFKWVVTVPGVISATLFFMIIFYAHKKGIIG